MPRKKIPTATPQPPALANAPKAKKEQRLSLADLDVPDKPVKPAPVQTKRAPGAQKKKEDSPPQTPRAPRASRAKPREDPLPAEVRAALDLITKAFGRA